MLHSWGRGKDGRLGHADGSADHSEPRAVEALADIPLELVALGNCHGGAVTSTGEVYMWGGGAFGELGLGDAVEEAQRPRLLAALQGHRVLDLSCGFYHTACVTADGSVWTWGWGRDGQLGHGEASATPVRVRALAQQPASRVACGHHATCALGRDGDVYAWGNLSDSDGSSGGGETSRTGVHRVGLPNGATRAIAVGGKHALATLADGRLFAWGCGRHGQLGLGDRADRLAPAHLVALRMVSAAGGGEAHSAALALLAEPLGASGRLVACVWGRSHYGGSGSGGGGEGAHAWPRALHLPLSMGSALELRTIACGFHHVACLTADGRVLTWAASATAAAAAAASNAADAAGLPTPRLGTEGDPDGAALPSITSLAPPRGMAFTSVACGGFSTAALAVALQSVGVITQMPMPLPPTPCRLLTGWHRRLQSRRQGEGGGGGGR